MKFLLAPGSILSSTHDLAAIAVHGDPAKDPLFKAADKALGGALRDQAAAEEFAGTLGQIVFAHSHGGLPSRFIAVIGAGDRNDFEPSHVRDIAASVLRLAKRLRLKDVAIALPSHRDSAATAQFAVEGAILGGYDFSKYRNGDSRKPHELDALHLDTERKLPGGKKASGKKKSGLGPAIARGESIARAICAARDMINEPAGVMTPAQLAEDAKDLAKRHGLSIKVLGPKECAKLGMGMFLAVAQGSAQEARLIHLTYKPKRKAKKRIALIGKGVTFDSGGYSLKPSASMEDMKIDMSGAAAVISAMAAIAELGSPFEVHAIAACAENLVSGSAYKLGDVLHAMDGTTVEINNTDAEGRLTLGDAITYARQTVKPDEIFDFATLTGACVIALGPYTAGVMSDSESLVDRWIDAARAAGEDVWRLPLHPQLKDQLKSPIADMRNTGERYGGALTAGLFLKHFAKDTPWVHVDIAGPASANRDNGATQRGGTGYGVASIVRYLT